MGDQRDSGTQPTPHYCTSRVRGDGTVAGCPLWPGCLFPGAAPVPADIMADIDAAVAMVRRKDWRQIGDDLTALAGWAAGGVVLLFVVLALLPFCI